MPELHFTSPGAIPQPQPAPPAQAAPNQEFLLSNDGKIDGTDVAISELTLTPMAPSPAHAAAGQPGVDPDIKQLQEQVASLSCYCEELRALVNSARPGTSLIEQIEARESRTAELLKDVKESPDLATEWQNLQTLTSEGATGQAFNLRMVRFQGRVQELGFRTELIAKVVGGVSDSTRNVLQTQA